jgi:hypothetical protein
MLTKLLTALKAHFLRYTAVIERQRGYAFSWSITNSNEVIKRSKHARINGQLTIADFSTLYTSFEHDTILKSMTNLVNLLFKNANKKYLALGKTAYFHNSEAKNRQRITKELLMEMIHFIISNSYVKHAGMLFHQTKGIPMGGNASPLIADLCLSMLEYKYIMSHPTEGRQLTHTMRYIDDILTLNTTIMKDTYKDIYDASLPLSFDDTDNGTGHFLDLQINRNTGVIDLYDKRNDFNFNVIRFTFANSNCPRNIGLNTLYSQIVRIARICSSKNEFDPCFDNLVIAMLSKGFTTTEVTNTVCKVSVAHSAILRKFDLNTRKQSIKRMLRFNQ